MADKPNKSTIKTANTSIASQKKPKFLELFGWCCRQDTPPKLESKRMPIAFPSTVIDPENPPLQSLRAPSDEVKTINPQSELISAPTPKVYPIDRVFILGDSYKLVAKVTKKPILTHGIPQMPSFGTLCKEFKRQKTLEEIETREVSTEIKKEIFSKYDKGIKAAEWYQITPEKIAVHIAKRLQCGIMVDALCGFGGNTIQFAKYCDYVLGIDIDPTVTVDAKHNAKIYGVDHKIDFITVDFLKLKNLMGDVVYLAPSDTRKSADEPFSIFKHTDPDLRQLLAKSLEISHSIAIKLPEDTDIEELAQLFQVSLEQYRSYSRRFCVEIERIVNSNDETECVMVYFGDCSSISLSEEHEAIYEYLAEKEENPEWRVKFPHHIVLTIVRSIGARKFLHYVGKVEEELSQKEKGTNSIFEILLDKLIEDNIFTKNSLKKLLEEASLSIKARLSLSKKRSQRSKCRSTNKISSAMTAITTDHNSEVTQLESRLKMSGKFSEFLLGSHKEEENGLIESFDENGPYLIATEFNPGTIVINSSEDNDDEDDDDCSALSVSSYSVSSDYLKDYSESEITEMEKDTRRSRRLIDISFEESDRASSLPKNESLKNSFLKPALKGIFRGGSTPNIAFMSDKSDKENITPKKTVRFGLKLTSMKID